MPFERDSSASVLSDNSKEIEKCTSQNDHSISVYVADDSCLFSNDVSSHHQLQSPHQRPFSTNSTISLDYVQKMLLNIASPPDHSLLEPTSVTSTGNTSPISMTPPSAKNSPELIRDPTLPKKLSGPGITLKSAQQLLINTKEQLSNDFHINQQPKLEKCSELFDPLHSQMEKMPINWSPPLAHSPINSLSPRSSPIPPISASSPSNSRIYGDQSRYAKSGYLIKQGGSWKSWKRRFFVLQNNNLFYFRCEDDAKKDGVLPLGVIPLSSFFSLSKCKLVSKEDVCSLIFSGFFRKKAIFMFKIETVQRTWLLCSDHEDDQLDWIRVLQELDRSNKRVSTNLSPSRNNEDVMTAGWLEKHTKGVVKRRWCVLKPDFLYMYKAPGDSVTKSVIYLDPNEYFIEVVSPLEEDSDCEDELKIMKGKQRLFHRFALRQKNNHTTWFRCDSDDHLEMWIHNLQSSIRILPSCCTLFETLMFNIIQTAFENSNDLDLENPNSLAFIDSIRISHSVLCFERDPRSQDLPLTTLPTKRLIDESLNIAKAIDLFTNTLIESAGIEYHLSLVQALIQSCIENPPLQNELLLQLTKQSTRHPYPNNTKTIQMWQLFSLALSIFTPIRDAYYYIRFHLVRSIHRYENELLSEYAYHCLRMLVRATEGGDVANILSKELPLSLTNALYIKNRKMPPSYMESINVLSTAEPPHPMRILIDCRNDEMLSVPFEPFTTVSDIIKTLKTALGLNEPNSPLTSDEYRLFLRSPDQDGSFKDFDLELLKYDDFLGDIVYKVDSLMRKKKRQSSHGWWWLDETNNVFLVFKIRFFLPLLKSLTDNIVPLILNNCSENEKRFIVNYAVESLTFRKFDYDQLLSITAYFAQIQWGDHYPLIQNRQIVHSQINYLLGIFHGDYMPKIKLDSQPGQVFQVVTQSDSLLGEISNKWMCLRGKSTESAMDGFLKLTLYPILKYKYRLYVECCGHDMGEICKISISTDGISINLYGKSILKCDFGDIVYYVEVDEKSLILGVRAAAIEDKILMKKVANSETARLTLLLADDQLYSYDFIHIFTHFCEINRVQHSHQS